MEMEMEMKNKLILSVVFTYLTVASFSSSAALVGRDLDGNLSTIEAYYDDIANLTWLADANAAGTTMNWVDANNWAAGLNFSGVTGWRLADTLQPDASCDRQVSGVSVGINCTGSEMGNLFYNVLGGVAGSPLTVTSNTNYNLFSNVQSAAYWSATESASNSSNAYRFNMSDGNTGVGGKRINRFAWAVQSGSVGVSVVPVPAAVWLFSSGLIGMIGFARRKKS